MAKNLFMQLLICAQIAVWIAWLVVLSRVSYKFSWMGCDVRLECRRIADGMAWFFSDARDFWVIDYLCELISQLVEKLSAKAPDGQTKLKVLTAIAEEHNVKWNPDTFSESDPKPPQDLLVRESLPLNCFCIRHYFVCSVDDVFLH